MLSWLKRKSKSATFVASHTTGESLSGMLRDGKQLVAPGDYGMWFSAPDDKIFSVSPTLHNIDRVYEATSGVEDFVFADVLRCVGATERDIRQVPLPEELAVIPVIGPHDLGFLVSASREKGIRLHFNRSTTPTLRTRALLEFASHFETHRQKNQKAISPLAYAGADWWTAMKKVANEVDATADHALSIGKVVYEV